MPSQIRLSSDANDFKSKLQDCSFLERVLWFSCHVLADGFLVGFSFLHFMFLFVRDVKQTRITTIKRNEIRKEPATVKQEKTNTVYYFN